MSGWEDKKKKENSANTVDSLVLDRMERESVRKKRPKIKEKKKKEKMRVVNTEKLVLYWLKRFFFNLCKPSLGLKTNKVLKKKLKFNTCR